MKSKNNYYIFLCLGIILSLLMFSSCEPEKDKPKETTKPNPTATNEGGINFDDLTSTKSPEIKGTPSITATHKQNTAEPGKTKETSKTASPTQGTTAVPSFDDDNWSGLY